MRRQENSLAAIYKNIMITKRDLIDLRQSIARTLLSIQKADKQISQNDAAAHPQPRNLDEANALRNNQSFQNVQCAECHQMFRNNEGLENHLLRKHPKCMICDKAFQGQKQTHKQQECGQIKVLCCQCDMMIKRKDLDSHIKACFFRQCFKCKSKIYCQAYQYHLLECKRTNNKNMISPCKRLFNQRKRPRVLPCSLVLNDYE